MNKYLRVLMFGAFGLVAVLSIYSICQDVGVVRRKPTTARHVLVPGTPKMEKFEWRQPLLHPTYPPKLVQGEKEFVLK